MHSGLQTPVFRGDIAGRLVLGRGFIPRKQPALLEERALEIERKAQGYLQEYQSRIGPLFGDLSQ